MINAKTALKKNQDTIGKDIKDQDNQIEEMEHQNKILQLKVKEKEKELSLATLKIKEIKRNLRYQTLKPLPNVNFLQL